MDDGVDGSLQPTKNSAGCEDEDRRMAADGKGSSPGSESDGSASLDDEDDSESGSDGYRDAGRRGGSRRGTGKAATRKRRKRPEWTRSEEETLAELHCGVGNQWSVIAARLPGRTPNEVKNIWHSTLRSKHLKARSLLRAYATTLNGRWDDETARQEAYNLAMRHVGDGVDNAGGPAREANVPSDVSACTKDVQQLNPQENCITPTTCMLPPNGGLPGGASGLPAALPALLSPLPSAPQRTGRGPVTTATCLPAEPRSAHDAPNQRHEGRRQASGGNKRQRTTFSPSAPDSKRAPQPATTPVATSCAQGADGPLTQKTPTIPACTDAPASQGPTNVQTAADIRQLDGQLYGRHEVQRQSPTMPADKVATAEAGTAAHRSATTAMQVAPMNVPTPGGPFAGCGPFSGPLVSPLATAWNLNAPRQQQQHIPPGASSNQPQPRMGCKTRPPWQFKPFSGSLAAPFVQPHQPPQQPPQQPQQQPLLQQQQEQLQDEHHHQHRRGEQKVQQQVSLQVLQQPGSGHPAAGACGGGGPAPHRRQPSFGVDLEGSMSPRWLLGFEAQDSWLGRTDSDMLLPHEEDGEVTGSHDNLRGTDSPSTAAARPVTTCDAEVGGDSAVPAAVVGPTVAAGTTDPRLAASGGNARTACQVDGAAVRLGGESLETGHVSGRWSSNSGADNAPPQASSAAVTPCPDATGHIEGSGSGHGAAEAVPEPLDANQEHCDEIDDSLALVICSSATFDGGAAEHCLMDADCMSVIASMGQQPPAAPLAGSAQASLECHANAGATTEPRSTYSSSNGNAPPISTQFGREAPALTAATGWKPPLRPDLMSIAGNGGKIPIGVPQLYGSFHAPRTVQQFQHQQFHFHQQQVCYAPGRMGAQRDIKMEALRSGVHTLNSCASAMVPINLPPRPLGPLLSPSVPPHLLAPPVRAQRWPPYAQQRQQDPQQQQQQQFFQDTSYHSYRQQLQHYQMQGLPQGQRDRTEPQPAHPQQQALQQQQPSGFHQQARSQPPPSLQPLPSGHQPQPDHQRQLQIQSQQRYPQQAKLQMLPPCANKQEQQQHAQYQQQLPLRPRSDAVSCMTDVVTMGIESVIDPQLRWCLVDTL